MASDTRSRSRQRISALFGRARSSSRSRGEQPVRSGERSFEATGRNRLIKERNGPTDPGIAYPPSSFRGPAEPGFERRLSWASTTSAASARSLAASVRSNGTRATGSRAPSPADELARVQSRPASVTSKRSSRSGSIYSIEYSQTSPLDAQGDVLVVTPDKKKSKGRSWLPQPGKNRASQHQQAPPIAWIAGDKTKVQYNLTPLTTGDKVPELWDEAGGMFESTGTPDSAADLLLRHFDLLVSSSILEKPIFQDTLLSLHLLEAIGTAGESKC